MIQNESVSVFKKTPLNHTQSIKYSLKSQQITNGTKHTHVHRSLDLIRSAWLPFAMHVTSHELPLCTLTAHESHREKGSTRHGDWVPLDIVRVPAQFWFSYSLTFQTIPDREIHSLARQEVLVRRATNLSGPLRLRSWTHSGQEFSPQTNSNEPSGPTAITYNFIIPR